MPNRNDRQRNDKRARKAAEVELTTYEKPNDPACIETRIPHDIDDPDYTISLRLVSLHGKLVEFSIVLSQTFGNESVEVYSVDSQHGYLHEHIHGHNKPKDRRDIKPLFSQVDVQESFDEPALQMVLKTYNRRRG